MNKYLAGRTRAFLYLMFISGFFIFCGFRVTFSEEEFDRQVQQTYERCVKTLNDNFKKSIASVLDKTLDQVKESYSLEKWRQKADLDKDNNIDTIELQFYHVGELSKSRFRQMVITYVDTLLKNINSSEKLKSHLPESPFSSKRLHLTFYEYVLEGGSYKARSEMSLSEGLLVYRTDIVDNEYREKAYETLDFSFRESGL